MWRKIWTRTGRIWINIMLFVNLFSQEGETRVPEVVFFVMRLVRQK